MSYQFYLILHLIGIFLVLLPLGGIALHMMNGGTREFPNRKLMAITHGVGLLIVFVAGFGLMARLGMVGGGWPLWIQIKLLIWILLGLLPLLIYRKIGNAKIHFALIVILAGLSAYMAVYKPTLSSDEPAAEMQSLEESEPEVTPEPEMAAPPSESPDTEKEAPSK